jgi:hypothetical protein
MIIIISSSISSGIMAMELASSCSEAVHTTPDTGPAAHVAMAVAHTVAVRQKGVCFHRLCTICHGWDMA